MTWPAAAVRVLTALATCCLVVGVPAAVLHREVLDGARFAQHVDAVRTDPHVAGHVGDRIAWRLVRAEPDLLALRPLLAAAATTVVASPAFGGAVRRGVEPLHERLLDGSAVRTVALTVSDVAVLLEAAAAALPGPMVDRLPTTAAVELPVTARPQEGPGADGGGTADRVAAWAGAADVLSWLMPLLALLGLGGALVLDERGASGRSRAGRRLERGAWLAGTSLTAAAAALVPVLLLVEAVAADADLETVPGALGAAAWDELRSSFWLAVGAVGLGGLTLLHVGGRDRSATASGAASEPRADLPHGRRAGRAVVHGVVWGCLGAMVLYAAWPVTADLPAPEAGAKPDPEPTGRCNGSAALCDKPYDRAVFPATHNSMSAADEPGWFFAEQPTGVLGQLEDGVRAFLIDTWYGQPTEVPGVVAAPDATRRAAFTEAVRDFGRGPVRSALRLRRLAGLEPTGPVEPYLCHAMCELGAVRWATVMHQVAGWLDDHPEEVVTFILQDSVAPADTATVLEEAGLLDQLHTAGPGRRWPTLGEMVGSGRRIVVFAENVGGGRRFPWLMSLDDWVQDTPFRHRSIDDLDCRPNRGRRDATMLLVNHWLDSRARRVSSADRVNEAEVLLRRVRTCWRARAMRPTFLAVDFYDRGDLLPVVRRLNGAAWERLPGADGPGRRAVRSCSTGATPCTPRR